MEKLPISRASLSSRLAIMVDAGLMQRNPPDAKRAQYLLTEKGLALEKTFNALSDWSSSHLFENEEKPKIWPS